MNELIKQETTEITSLFESEQSFALGQRMAKPLAENGLVPDTFRGKLPECMIALEMAQRVKMSPLAVMQNLYIVHGRPSWSSQFLIACINACHKFSPLRYDMSGDGDDYGCFAWAYDKATGERLEGPKVTIRMAKAEGWYSKNGSKWKTMPDLMLRYRAATLFARLFAPEVTLGMQTEDEIIDITPINGSDPEKKKKTRFERVAEEKEQLAIEAVTATEKKAAEADESEQAVIGRAEACGITVEDVKEWCQATKQPYAPKMMIPALSQILPRVRQWCMDNGRPVKPM